MTFATIGLAWLSGLLSTLSPCVLPLIPIVVGTAMSGHRWGPFALALGLALSFTAFGLLIATIGFAVGLDPSWIRKIAGVLMLIFGTIMLVPFLQERFTQWSSVAASAGGQWSRNIEGRGLGSQFALGVLLGAVWTPCVGPTLGAAATLASSGENLGTAAITMLTFGVGAAMPLAVMGLISRKRFMQMRSNLGGMALWGKKILGVLFLLLGIGIVTGYDHKVETWLVKHSPAALTDLTTRF